MKYLSGEQDLLRWCASSHLLAMSPVCIVVDGVTNLLDGAAVGAAPREVRLARCLAMLADAATHAGERLLARGGSTSTVRGAAAHTACQLLIGDRCSDGGEAPPLWFVWRRWTPLVLTCRSLRSGHPGPGAEPVWDGGGTVYTLGVLPTDGGPKGMAHCRYSVTSSAIVADGVVDAMAA
jgi:hypothetical protein